MKQIISNIKSRFGRKPDYSDDVPMDQEGYVELAHDIAHESKGKIIVRPFVIEDFADIKPILDALREGYTICLINISPIKEKDLNELKRSINKLKKTAEAIEGDIAGFGEDWLVIAPNFAQIYRPPKQKAAPVEMTESQDASDDEK
ncbi:MAG: cell division protein SepF [Nanoarchaeota archaeon]|nr:cell division protein SepF [Nanoarchaeota archaeon]